MEQFSIRKATPDDTLCIVTLVRELARYEKSEHKVSATQDLVRDSLFRDTPFASAILCQRGSEVIGIAIYYYSFSSWLGMKGLFLEDLYVLPEHRGIGAGLALFKHVAGVAHEQGCGRFEWNVLDWNQPAIEFYRSVGATAHPEWIRYRLDESGIAELLKMRNSGVVATRR